MNNNANKPVVVSLQYTSSDTVSNTHAGEKETVQSERNFAFQAIDESHKLVRRYSFDDNGGGYSGL